MEQIYYTQCPRGYGLGATNGFQIKRVTDGYLTSGSSDYRHLGMRAFLGGSQTLAPAALRYRRDGSQAEVALLSPREREYETDRGPSGRPGGHFAHGLKLEESELARLDYWPAGLWDWPHWRREDKAPSMGRRPDELPSGWPDLAVPSSFAAVAATVRDRDPVLVAGLLSGVAVAVRSGHCLFLIDEPLRLAHWVAVLTFAFPPTLRSGLTFSTYHDRPEELPGFRIQGTTPANRPNRAALAGLGVVADLPSGTFEPAVAPEVWSCALAGWLTGGDAEAEAAWHSTAGWAERVAESVGIESVWSEEYLNRLFAFQHAVREQAPPRGESSWLDLRGAAEWASAVGLAREWMTVRGPNWWAEQKGSSAAPAAREALLSHATLKEAWSSGASTREAKPSCDGELAAAWGRTIAAWFGDFSSEERCAAIDRLVAGVPVESLPHFLPSLVGFLPASAGEEAVRRLAADGRVDDATRFPLEARGAVSAVTIGNLEPLMELLSASITSPDAFGPTLRALAEEIGQRPSVFGTVASALGDVLRSASGLGRQRAINVILQQGGDQTSRWLGSYLGSLFAADGFQAPFRELRESTPRLLRPELARAAVSTARDADLTGLAFCWSVEELLLPIEEKRRPYDASWPQIYLERTPSGLDSVQRLFSKEHRDRPLFQWIASAVKRNEVSAEQLARLRSWKRVAEAVDSKDVFELLDVDPAQIPPAERGRWLDLLLGRVGDVGSEIGGQCLDWCVRAWPKAFEPGAPGLASLARPLAEALLNFRVTPDRWFERLKRLLHRLTLDEKPATVFAPHSLGSEIAAATMRLAVPGYSPWRLREFLLRRDDAWKLLAADARLDLSRAGVLENLDAFRHWEANLPRPAPQHEPRFFELMLNVSGPETLVAIVTSPSANNSIPTWAAYLKDLPPLSWWPEYRPSDARDDLRDRFARLAPLAPLPEEALPSLERWLGPPLGKFSALMHQPEDDLERDLVPLEKAHQAWTRLGAAGFSHLSPRGLARWYCLHRLTILNRAGQTEMGRWQEVLRWPESRLPLRMLGSSDRHRMLAWAILRTDFWDTLQLDSHDTFLNRLAEWLCEEGFSSLADLERLRAWDQELIGLVDSAELDRARVFRPKFVSALSGSIERNLPKDQRLGENAVAQASP
jgi:hypothetical protein